MTRLDPCSPTNGSASEFNAGGAVEGGVEYHELVIGLRAQLPGIEVSLELAVHANQLWVGVGVLKARQCRRSPAVAERSEVEAAALAWGPGSGIAVRSAKSVKGQRHALDIHIDAGRVTLALRPGDGDVEAELVIEGRTFDAGSKAIGVRFPLSFPCLSTHEARGARVTHERSEEQGTGGEDARIFGLKIDHPGMVHLDEAVRPKEGLRRIGRRGFPLRDLHLRIEAFEVKLDVLGQIVGHLAEELVGILLFYKVVELGELEAAGAVVVRISELFTARVSDPADNSDCPSVCVSDAKREDRSRVSDARIAALGVGGEGTHGPVEVTQAHFAPALILGCRGEVPAVIAAAPDDASLVLPIGFFESLTGNAGLDTFEVFPGDEVHDPGNGVRAVERRCAILENLKAANSDAGDCADIHADVGVCHVATSVDQHQRAGRAEAPQVNGVNAFVTLTAGTVKLVRFGQVTVRNIEVSHHLSNGGVSDIHEVLLANHIDGQGRVLRGATDKGAGDYHLFNRLLRENHGGCGQNGGR